METAWIQSILYQPPAVLGKSLKPFSPFHALVLDSIESPYMRGGNATPDDLITAVYVCSCSWSDRARILNGDKAELRKWGKDFCRADWQSEFDAFNLYLSESWTTPTTWKRGDGGTVKASGAFHMTVFAMRILGMNEADSWDAPLARLVCYRETYTEQETGKSDLQTDDERHGKKVLEDMENGNSKA